MKEKGLARELVTNFEYDEENNCYTEKNTIVISCVGDEEEIRFNETDKAVNELKNAFEKLFVTIIDEAEKTLNIVKKVLKKLILALTLLLVACGNEVVELENGISYEIKEVKNADEVRDMTREAHGCPNNGAIEKCKNVWYDMENKILYYAEPVEPWDLTLEEAQEILHEALLEEF